MAHDKDTSRTSHGSDPSWKHCHLMDESNFNTIVGNYCGKVMKEGVTRAKEHLIAKKGNVIACTKTPKNKREELRKLFIEKADSSFVNPGYSVANDNHERRGG